MEYQSQEAYPPVAVEGPNEEYAQLMLGNLGGYNSEMTTVGSYFYHHLVTAATDPTLSELFLKIAQVEMRHMELFGQLAVRLGADPRLWECRKGQYRFWTPGYISYPQDICSILRASFAGEQEAVRRYRQQISVVQDQSVRAILQRILQDEQLHAALFKERLQDFLRCEEKEPSAH